MLLPLKALGLVAEQRDEHLVERDAGALRASRRSSTANRPSGPGTRRPRGLPTRPPRRSPGARGSGGRRAAALAAAAAAARAAARRSRASTRAASRCSRADGRRRSAAAVPARRCRRDHRRRRRAGRGRRAGADRRRRIEQQRVFANQPAGRPRDLEDDVDEGLLHAAIADQTNEQAAVGALLERWRACSAAPGCSRRWRRGTTRAARRGCAGSPALPGVRLVTSISARSTSPSDD